MIDVAESRLLPQLGASASSTQMELSENVPVLDSFFRRGQVEPRQEFFSASFDAAWELDFFGGNRRRAEAAEARAEAVEEMRRGAVLTVVAEVAATYVDLQANRQQAGIVARQIKLAAERIDLVKAGLDSGTFSELDRSRAQAGKKALEARLPALRAAEAASIYRIAVLTGQEPSRMFEQLAVTPPLPSLPDVVRVGLPGEMLRRRPDVARAERTLAAATAEVGAAAALLHPSFSLTGMIGRQGGAFTDLYNSASGTWMIVPGLRWPLFQGGRIRAGVDAAEDAREAARLAYRGAILKAVSGVETALSRYARAFESREHLQEMLARREWIVSLADAGYDAGVFSRLDLLSAREKMLKVERKLTRSRAEVIRALIGLNKELGGGWEFSGRSQPAVSLSR
jgi:NodT family efflux transporter outer membrane factor (OMF) lipoprotein